MSSTNQWNRIAKRIRVPLGFVFAGIYLWLAQPTWLSLALGAAAAAPGVAIRAAAAGHVRKNAELTTTGPYAYTRNPLYLGSLIMAIGFGVASRSIWVGACIVLLFLAIYLPVIRGEEDFLGGAFAGFDDYRAHVPRLLPRLSAWNVSGDHEAFSAQRYWKHREYNALVGALAMLVALAVKILWHRVHS